MSEYRSNNGKGPLRARIVSVDGDLVTLERWNEKRPNRKTVFQLARWYLGSRSCGWKKVMPAKVAGRPEPLSNSGSPT